MRDGKDHASRFSMFEGLKSLLRSAVAPELGSVGSSLWWAEGA